MLPGLINLLTDADGPFGLAKKTYSALATDGSRTFIPISLTRRVRGTAKVLGGVAEGAECRTVMARCQAVPGRHRVRRRLPGYLLVRIPR